MENEPSSIVPEEETKEPTVIDLISACSDVLDPESCEDLRSMEIGDAIGYAFTLLIEAGIDDPEGFLREKDILI